MMVGLIAILVIGCSSGENDVTDSGETDGLAATVNNVEISTEKFEKAVDRMVSYYEQQGLNFEEEEGRAFLEQIRQQAINELVQEEVLLQSAKEKGYDVSDEIIAEELEQIKAQFSTDEEFQIALEQNKLTEDELKSMIVSELQIEKFIKNEIPEVTVIDEEIQQMYDQYKVQYETQKGEDTEEDQEFPSFEEAKAEIEAQLKQQKEQEQFGKLIEELMENSDIEIFI